MSSKTKSSVGSFFNADSGVEWALNKIANTDGSETITAALSGVTTNSDGSADCPFDGCRVYFLKNDGTVIPKSQFGALTVADIKAVRSIGSQGEETQRAIEAAVAAQEVGGSYINWSNNVCASGWTTAYQGRAYVVGAMGGNWSSAGIVCWDITGVGATTGGSSSISEFSSKCTVCVK